MQQTESEVNEIVRSAVRKKAGLHALQRIRKIVDDEQEADRKNALAAKWISLGILLFIVLTSAWIYYPRMSQPALPRPAGHSPSPALHSYISLLREHIEQQAGKRRKNTAGAHGAMGTVSMRIAVRANGQLEEVVLLKSSGTPSLDEAALGLVKAASPMPPFPKELQRTMDVFELETSLSIEE